MKLTTDVKVEGKDGLYETAAISHKAEVTLTEIGPLTIDDLTPEHVEQLRERVAASLKETGKKLGAELDVLEEQALARAAVARGVRDAAKQADENPF